MLTYDLKIHDWWLEPRIDHRAQLQSVFLMGQGRNLVGFGTSGDGTSVSGLEKQQRKKASFRSQFLVSGLFVGEYTRIQFQHLLLMIVIQIYSQYSKYSE